MYGGRILQLLRASGSILPVSGLCLLISFSVFAGPAERFERLVMPGELSTAHAKYEKTCEKCHAPFKKGAQNDLCMDCHKETGRDVQNKQGMHGRIKSVRERDCSLCHKEHRGRDAEIMPFDADTFDHSGTDFPLHGAHENLSCQHCHKQNEKYRKAAVACGNCHKDDDVHKQRLGKECEACHVDLVWGMGHYDHDKTKFKLKHRHRQVACADCHPNQQYRETPRECVSCHELDDVHKKDHGKKCQDCHIERSWSDIRFDHDKDTKYPLEGRHSTIDCQACHKGDVYKDIKKDCITCHKHDDAHKTLFGEKCHECHSAKSWWRIIFDHNKTDYKLNGKHRMVACIACHKGDVFADLKTDCFSCHQEDDAHEGEQGNKCESCHNEAGWGKSVFFDHGLTRFPLLDSHAIVTCEECHFTALFNEAETQCKACHMHDDESVHKRRLGLNCELCHNANDWRKWKFDHDRQTDYKLTGVHRELNCHACHKEPVQNEIKLGMRCVDCHDRDDQHNGAFGKDCQRCHVTKSFREIKLVQ